MNGSGKMVILFQDNFSTLSNWGLDGTPSLQPSIFTGASALFCKPGDYAVKQFNPLASVYTEGDFYYDTALAPGQQVLFIHYQGVNGAEICFISIYVNTAGGPTTIMLWSPFGTLLGAVDIKPNTLVKVGLLYTSSTKGGYSAYINGTQVLTSGTVDTSSQQVNYIYAAMPDSTASTPDAVTQDITVYDSYPNSTPTEATLTFQSNVPTNLTINDQQITAGQSVTLTPGSYALSVLGTVAITTAAGGIPNSPIGTDYCQYFNWNADTATVVAGWQSVLQDLVTYKATTARLGMALPHEPNAGVQSAGPGSTYNYSKMSAVLNLLATVNVKGILVNQNPASGESWIGSQAWINDWVQIATDLKGDTRVKAFQLWGEPYSIFFSPTGPTGGITDMHSLNVAMAYLIDKIRAVDPTRTIMYPLVMEILTADANAFYNDLVAAGVIAKGNVLFDIVHPYYFESAAMDPVNDPVGDAAWYWNNACLPQIALFGAANCWCGETFPWVDTNGQANGGYNGTTVIHAAIQQQFEVAMINYFCSAGMRFQMWDFWGGGYNQAVACLNASNYPATAANTSTGTPVTTTYYFNNFELDGASIGTANPATITLTAGPHTLNAVYATSTKPTPKTSKAPLIALSLLGLTALGAVVVGSNKKGSR